MTRHQASKLKHDDDLTKYYIITRPTRLSGLNLDEFEDANWRNQSQQLQARRWKKLRHQVM